jgi:hypothetical protein
MSPSQSDTGAKAPQTTPRKLALLTSSPWASLALVGSNFLGNGANQAPSNRARSRCQLPVNYGKRPANTGVNTDGCTGSSARNFVARRHEILQESSQKFRVPRSASKFANCSSVRIYTRILWSPPVINPVIGRCDVPRSMPVGCCRCGKTRSGCSGRPPSASTWLA